VTFRVTFALFYVTFACFSLHLQSIKYNFKNAYKWLKIKKRPYLNGLFSCASDGWGCERVRWTKKRAKRSAAVESCSRSKRKTTFGYRKSEGTEGSSPFINIKRKEPIEKSVLTLVRVMGLEPIRRWHTPLKRACLPIPAHSHITILFLSAQLLYQIRLALSTLNLKILK